MNLNIEISWIDISVIVLYLIIVVGMGLWAGWTQRRKSSGSSFFLAGRSLTWPLIGLALFSTNISTIELVSLAEEGYKSGLLYGNLELMAGLALVILAIFFAPFYLRSRVSTLPEFLHRRYNNSTRVFNVVIAIVSAIFIHIGFALFAGAKVLEGLFDMPIMISITIILALTGLYTIVGGLKAVVLTEAVQTVVLVGGSIVMTLIGFNKLGGWSGLTSNVDPEMLTMLRSAERAPDMSWFSVFLGYPIIGIWYFCTDQTIVQRVLGAKDENHARLGPIFAGFIKLLPLFIFVMPGLIALALINQGTLPDDLDDTAKTYAYLVANILPIGVKGIVVAAMLAALMSTVSGALNSIATVFCFDIYKPLRPETSEKKLILVGRIATLVAILLAILWAPQISKFGSILEGNTAMISYLAPAITAVFLGGVLWKRASAKGAIITLSVGTVLGAIVFLLDWFKESTGWNFSFLLAGFFLFLISASVLIVTSYLYPQIHTAESESLIWKNPLSALRQPGLKGILNYKILSAVLIGLMIILYIIFR
jgi:SSS family solute:Na+ symporter